MSVTRERNKEAIDDDDDDDDDTGALHPGLLRVLRPGLRPAPCGQPQTRTGVPRSEETRLTGVGTSLIRNTPYRGIWLIRNTPFRGTSLIRNTPPP